MLRKCLELSKKYKKSQNVSLIISSKLFITRRILVLSITFYMSKILQPNADMSSFKCPVELKQRLFYRKM